jgi:acyl-CoA reductase-like NAD-dependent aldehyde dehydrogenase
MPRFTPEQKARISKAIEAILRRIREALRPLAQLVRETAKAIAQAAASVNRFNDVIRAAHRDRPAWASPYGPAPRRRHT